MSTTTSKSESCPECGSQGKGVLSITLRALLKQEFVGEVDDVNYKYCDNAGCDVVYYSDDQNFTKNQLKVSVGVKETIGERPLCYCFGHSVTSIKNELQTKGHSDALSDIREKMKNPGCRCETENPSGSCCLGSVAKGIKLAQNELEMNETDIQTPVISSTSKGEKIAKVGTLLSALMASSCCWLPLVLLAAGVSGAGVASTLEAYRPLFMVVTFGFLGAAFYFTYRPRKMIADGGNDCCATEPDLTKVSNTKASNTYATNTEDCCVPVTQGRLSMMTLNKLMLWGVTVMAVAFMFFPNYVGFILAGISSGDVVISSDNPLIRQTIINVEGMHCEGCAIGLEQAVKEVPGVLAVKVDYEKKQTIISTETCCAFPEATVLKAIEDAGFTGTVRISDDK